MRLSELLRKGKTDMDQASYEVLPIDKLKQVRFYTSYDNGSYVAPHWHDALEIIYMEKGHLTVQDNTGLTEMKPGSLILINANYVHSTKCIYPNQAIVFQIPLKLLDGYLPNLNSLQFRMNNEQTKDKTQLSKMQQFIDKITRMQAVNDEKPEGGMLIFNGLLYESLYQLYHDFSFRVYASSKEHHLKDIERLTPLLTFVSEHYREHISIEEAASIVGFEPRYFCRFFKKKMGVTFLEYQNDTRLVRIVRDIVDTDDMIKDILERHGFTNYKLFRRMFQEQFHMTPTQMRRRGRNTEG